MRGKTWGLVGLVLLVGAAWHLSSRGDRRAIRSSGAEPREARPELRVRGNPLLLAVCGPKGESLELYRVGLQTEGSRMYEWVQRRPFQSSSPALLMIPPGRSELLVQAPGRTLEGQAQVTGSGDGSPIHLVGQLKAE